MQLMGHNIRAQEHNRALKPKHSRVRNPKELSKQDRSVTLIWWRKWGFLQEKKEQDSICAWVGLSQKKPMFQENTPHNTVTEKRPERSILNKYLHNLYPKKKAENKN